MNNIVAICIMICSVTLVGVLTAVVPFVLSDANNFLLNFVNHEYVSFMGVLVTITLASTASIHIELNRYEEALGAAAFERSRANLRHSAFALIASLCAALLTVVIKPLGPASSYWQSGVNGFALLTIESSILIVADLTLAAFDLRPITRHK